MPKNEPTKAAATKAPYPIDRVAMASRKPDGTPAQTEPFEFIGDTETVQAAAATQVGEQLVSNADDAAAREALATATPAEPYQDPAVQQRIEQYEALQTQAEAQAAAEVKG